MTNEDAFKLLAFLSRAYPSLTVLEGMVGVWHGILEDLPADQVEAAAVKLARRGGPFAPSAGEVRAAVLAVRRDHLANDRGQELPPPVDPADPAAYRAALIASRRATAGTPQPPAPRAVEEGHRP